MNSPNRKLLARWREKKKNDKKINPWNVTAQSQTNKSNKKISSALHTNLPPHLPLHPLPKNKTKITPISHVPAAPRASSAKSPASSPYRRPPRPSSYPQPSCLAPLTSYSTTLKPKNPLISSPSYPLVSSFVSCLYPSPSAFCVFACFKNWRAPTVHYDVAQLYTTSEQADSCTLRYICARIDIN